MSRHLFWQRLACGEALSISAALLSVALGGTLMWFLLAPSRPQARRIDPPIPTTPVAIDGAPVVGVPTAHVVLIEFMDFQCPFSARFVSTIFPELRAKYVDTGRVQAVFKYLPLPIHNRAKRAAQAGTCADSQKRFWALHDRLFAAAGRLDEDQLADYAKQAGVSPVGFATCMSETLGSNVQRDIGLAKTLKINQTPTFLIGRRLDDGRVEVNTVLVGSRAVKDFDEAFRRAGM